VCAFGVTLTPPAWQANIREEIFVSERKLKKKKIMSLHISGRATAR
jgi:hypothetical protein